jgi:precorrin-4/cobalt-precorrin-4 C11-methyltransferase
MNGEVIFVGAGPGDPELITLAGYKALQSAEVVLYAGSLVNPEMVKYAPDAQEVHDTADMNLDETTAVCMKALEGKRVVRLHTGDPALYGAIQEQIEPLLEAGVTIRVIPGVSSAFASAAALKTQLTLPGKTQTVIFTRIAGRTPVPESESIEKLAATGATLCIFLSVNRIDEVVRACLKGGRRTDTPAAVVCRASWPDQRHVGGTLADIAEKTVEAGFTRQSMIIVGEALGPSVLGLKMTEFSKLYDPEFTHGYRKASIDEKHREGGK